MDPIRVLVVDDDDVDREKIHRLLGQVNFPTTVVEAGSGREALALLRQQAIDCVILDYCLGDATGTDLVPEIRRLGGGYCPVIMVTGIGDERIAADTTREGVYDYFSKNNLKAHQLSAAIEGSLHSAELERRLSQTQDRLQRLSLYDNLTGLPNRNLFFDRLEQTVLTASRQNARFSLLMMDLNLFKEVNDTLGHAAGDRLLGQVGARLQQVARRSDTVARLGGDEFAALILGTDPSSGTPSLAKKIIDALREPFLIDKRVVTIGIAIGIAHYPEHGLDGKTLLAKADSAMYGAKRSTRGYEVFSEDGTAPEPSSVLMANHLTRAIERQELFLRYQPKVNLRTRELVGVEALVRWDSPELGPLLPDQFIPAAERSSAIGPMTYAILDMALDQAVLWQEQNWLVPVAVNLSARLLDDERLTRKIMAALARRELLPQVLTLEITETALMASPDRVRVVLGELVDAGIAISIDDFGTGYTSFRYLRELDIAELKIDKLFVTHVHDHARDASIIRSIATLAQGFRIGVIAEGVEAQETWEELCLLGCELGQGYSIGRPMSAEALADWSQNWTIPTVTTPSFRAHGGYT